jgi:hypothetical protein
VKVSKVKMTAPWAVFALVATVSAVLLLPHAAGAATKKRAVPQGWVGVNVDPWHRSAVGLDFYQGANNELDRMVAAGVEAVRFPLYWFRIQPYASVESCLADWTPAVDCSQLVADPADPTAAPYSWGDLDAWVLAAAARGIKLLPNVVGAPLWAASREYPQYSSYNPQSTLEIPIPADNDQFARFTGVLVSRYGTNGTLWSENPSASKKPITTWQIWNEPDRKDNWPQHPGECVPQVAQMTPPSACPAVSFKVKRTDRKPTLFDLPNQTEAQWDSLKADRVVWPGILKALTAKKLVRLGWAPSFLKLMKPAQDAVKSADPAASVVMPGLISSAAPELDRFYRAGGRGTFDAVAANIFLVPAKAAVSEQSFRRVAAAYGDKTMPIYVSEFSWASGIDVVAPKQLMSSIVTDQAGQATKLTSSLQSYSAAASRDKILGAFWYRWVGLDTSSADIWDWTGLNSYDNALGSLPTPKPALGAFRTTALRLEACKSKLTATTCGK